MLYRPSSFLSLVLIFSLLLAVVVPGSPITYAQQRDGLVAAQGPHGTALGTIHQASLSFRAFLPIVMSARSNVEIIAGNNQTGVVGTAVAEAPKVRVLDAEGEPLPNARIDFEVAQGGGQVFGATQTTDAAGEAAVDRWQLGTTVGMNTLAVVYGGRQVLSFTAVSSAGPAAALLYEAGNGGQALVGTTRLLQARVVDVYNNPVSSHTVEWAVTEGTGTLTASTSTTDANGIAATTWTFGPTAGSQRVAAWSGNLLNSPLTYSVSAVAGAASTATSTISATPTAIVADGLSTATITVQLKDADGNNMTASGGVVTLTTTAGTLSPVTDHQDGTYTATLTAPTTTGSATISAMLAGTTLANTASVSFTTGAAAAVIKQSGDGGTAVIGTLRLLQVKVVDGNGNPVQNHTINWVVTTGGGSLSASSSTSNADGIAVVEWTLGTASGSQSVNASAAGLAGSPLFFSTTATAGPATRLVFTAQPSNTSAGAVISPAVQVTTQDAYGNTVTTASNSVTISLDQSAANMTLSGIKSVAAVNGVVTFGNLSINKAWSGYTLTASSDGLTKATSTAFDVTVGPPASIAKVAGDGQTAQVGTSVASAPVVLITDAGGNPVAVVPVTFAVTVGGGSLTGASATTNADGQAAVGSWTLGATAGENVLTATAGGLQVSFSATGTAGPATNLAKNTGDGQSAVVGTAVATSPTILVTDASGNPISGIAVTFAVSGGGGSITGASQTTDARGLAAVGSWTLGTTAGTNSDSLQASVNGLGSVTFSASATAATPAQLVFSVQPSNTIAAAAMTPAVQVTIRDTFGNVVSSATNSITLAIGNNPSGGTMSGTTTVAAVNGVATFSNLSINVIGSGYTLSASAGTLSGATSSAFNVTHGPLDHFLVEAAGGGPIGNQLANTPFNVRVTAQDEYNNTVTSFTGTVNFTSTPGGGISAGATSGAFTAGVLSSHSITFATSGPYTLTATSSSGTQSGTSNSFEVHAPPMAVNEGPMSDSSPGQWLHAFYSTTASPQTFNLSAPGVLSNDNLGFPSATITSFGGDSMGGTVTHYAAGTTVSPLPGDGRTTGSLRVNANGSITFTPPDGFTGNYVFRYRLTNVRGTSDAQVTIAVGERPSAVNDWYSHVLVGNVPINTATSTQFRVTTNDQGDANVLSITGQTNGTASINQDGTFTFRPIVGYGGHASFSYTVTNGFGTSPTATVSMTVDPDAVWFVNHGASVNGDGRYDTPFNSLASLAAINNGVGGNPAGNDTIFLYSGAHAGGLTLVSKQRLIGQGATASLSSLAGVTWPADSGAEPTMSGAAPTITTTTTNTNAINLGSDNTLRGFALGNATGVALNGSSFGTLTISEVGISTNGRAVNLTTGTLSGSLMGVTSTGGTNNIVLNGVNTSAPFSFGSGALSGATTAAFNVSGGNGSFSYGGTIANTSGFAVLDQNRTGGTLSLTGQITAGGSGISVTNSNTNLASTGTIELSNTGNTISSALGQTSLTVTNTTIASSGLKFRSITANGNNSAANGIMLNNTGMLGGLIVSGNGSAGTGGTIQNMTGNGIVLINTRSPSFAYMNIQNTGRSGINGWQLANFSFTNGTINNSGISGSDDADSNIDFFAVSTTTENNVSGVVTITGNVLTNARGHGIDIGNGNGIISDMNISNNTITSSTSATTSFGSGMRIVIDGSAGTVAHLTKATIANNVITNFPGGGGINVDCGNGDASGMVGTCGIVGSSTDKVSITGNRIAGDATTKMATKAIATPVAGKGQGNFEIVNNGTVAEPLRNTVGHVIDVNAFGQAQVTAIISGNHINANNVLSSRGIAAGADIATNFSTTALLTVTISNNTVSNTNGVGISATAVRSGTTVKASITNNNVSAPTGGNYGIAVFTNPDNTVTPTVCVNISGNTTAGGTASGTTWPGIGLTKRTSSTFGIVGLSPSPTGTPTVENYVNSLNTSASGSFGTGGTALGSATTGFTSCTI